LLGGNKFVGLALHTFQLKTIPEFGLFALHHI
jgi:hypothetical protein